MTPTSRKLRISELARQQLGPYQIVATAGRGGMGVVYRGFQPALQRYVAIKVLSPSFLDDDTFRSRFHQEAATVARLEHPNILPIYDYGQEGEFPYIVMPLVTGGTLRDWLAPSRPLEQALLVFSRVLAALEYAHASQPAIVHRDIKPSNILMSHGDWPLLCDFGLAKIIEPSLRAAGARSIVGTPQFMAPEQSLGQRVDHRADLYAMGITLYEMLTGRLPFEGQTPLAIMFLHVHEPIPSPRMHNPELSPVWEEVIQRSLAKAPQDRYPSARAMAEAVEAAWHQIAASAPGVWASGSSDPGALYASALQAVEAGNWPEVISLCGRLLAAAPAHPGAVHLLAQAHAALQGPREAEALARREGAASDLDQRRAVAAAPPTRPRPATAGPRRRLPPTVASGQDAGATAVSRARRPETKPHPTRGLRMVPPLAALGWCSSAPARASGLIGALAALLDRGRGRRGFALVGGVAVLAAAAIGLAVWLRGSNSQALTASTAAPPVLSDSRVSSEITEFEPALRVAPTATPQPSAADLFERCARRVAETRWEDAVLACEQVWQLDQAYAGVAEALAQTYLALGQEQLSDAAGLSTALDYFDQALFFKPDDPEAAQQRHRAAAYLAGESEAAAGNWPGAVEQFERVYGEAPDYFAERPDDRVQEKLQAARLGWGQVLLDAGEPVEAQRRCEEALEVAPEAEAAIACRDAARAELALAAASAEPPTSATAPSDPALGAASPASPPAVKPPPRPAALSAGPPAASGAQAVGAATEPSTGSPAAAAPNRSAPAVPQPAAPLVVQPVVPVIMRPAAAPGARPAARPPAAPAAPAARPQQRPERGDKGRH